MRIDKYTHEHNRKTIEALPDKINTYVPISAGVESTAAYLYAINDPDIHPLCVNWYDPQWGEAADAMLTYGERLCKLYDAPLVVWNTGNIATENEVPIVISGLAAWMATVVGNKRFNWKWFMGSGNAEDDIRMRNQFKEYRRIISQHYSDSLDGHGFSIEAIIKTPEVRYPFEYMSKSELLAFVKQTDPEAYKLLWTCATPKGTLKEEGEIVGYVPCHNCKKCGEFKAAEIKAMEAVHRVATGKSYSKNFGWEYSR
jgi:hypothetical protein